ncbi:MAG: GNAT family N-acetyltransferase [Phenylobacterium sp.]|nr:GNAT family N-acetyltransferase [Phenylobacterium sp.]
MQTDRLRLVAYRPELRARWNAFVTSSKNGTFLFDRDFMEHHADRFEDASLVAFEGPDESNIVALLPATRLGDRLISHGGLTYGGWVTDRRMTTAAMLILFDLLRSWSGGHGVAELRYKATPRCYHSLPADEDLYALFRQGAVVVRQDVTSVIDLNPGVAWSKGKRHALSKARKLGVTAVLSDDFDDFHEALREVLSAHDATPAHSVDDLKRLVSRFPEHIRLYAADLEGRAIAYALVFDCGQTAHTQYLAARPEGRQSGGLETIVQRLQFEDFSSRRFLSFGISTTNDGRTLNLGLVAQKEMFGARALICPHFDLAF